LTVYFERLAVKEPDLKIEMPIRVALPSCPIKSLLISVIFQTPHIIFIYLHSSCIICDTCIIMSNLIQDTGISVAYEPQDGHPVVECAPAPFALVAALGAE
jgi:hypothetical protein